MQFTRLSWVGLVSAAAAVQVTGQDSTASVTNSAMMNLSLDDCIRMALKDNLTLQVGDRIALGELADLDLRSEGAIGLENARLAVASSLGYYDPNFRAGGGQRFQERIGRIDPAFGSIPLPGGERWNEDFFLGFDGVLPTGTRYELGGSLNRLSGNTVQINPFPAPPNTLPPENIPWQYSSQVELRVTQPLLRDFWTDAGRVTIKLRRKDLKIAEHSLRLLTMDILQRVAVAYYDLIAARDQVKTREKALELAAQLVSEYKTKIDVGQIAPLAGRESEAQEASAKAQLTAARFAVEEAENVLKGLISHDFSHVQGNALVPSEKLVPTYQAFSLPDAWRNGLEKRPDYLAEKEQVEKRKIELQYRRNQLYPALDLVGTYGRNGLAESTTESFDNIADNRFPYYGGAVTLSFPLTFKKDRAEYKGAKNQQVAAILSLKRREDSILQEIDTAVKKVRSAYEQTESTRVARRFAEEALDAEQKKFDVGRVSSFFVLRLQKDLTDARAAEIQAAADYNKALHELYFKEGTSLERNRVDLEFK